MAGQQHSRQPSMVVRRRQVRVEPCRHFQPFRLRRANDQTMPSHGPGSCSTVDFLQTPTAHAAFMVRLTLFQIMRRLHRARLVCRSTTTNSTRLGLRSDCALHVFIKVQSVAPDCIQERLASHGQGGLLPNCRNRRRSAGHFLPSCIVLLICASVKADIKNTGLCAIKTQSLPCVAPGHSRNGGHQIEKPLIRDGYPSASKASARGCWAMASILILPARH